MGDVDGSLTFKRVVNGSYKIINSSWQSVSSFVMERIWPTSAQHGLSVESQLLFDYGGLDPLHARNYFTKTKKGFLINTYAIDSSRQVQVDEDNILENSGEWNGKAPVLFCHGYGAGLGYFYKNVKSVQRGTGRRIYLMDWVGMGRSSRPHFPWIRIKDDYETEQAIDFFVDSLEDWRQQHSDAQKIILVGHSLGGYLCSWYALKYPERVEKLVLVSPVGLPEKPHTLSRSIPKWVHCLWNNNFTPQFIIRSIGPFGPKLVKYYTDRRFMFKDEQESTIFRDYLYHISADKGSGEYALGSVLAPGAYARIPLHPKLPFLQVPTRFLYGDSDWMDSNHAQKVVPLMTIGSKVEEISNAGHNLFLDNPDQFNQVLIDYINE